MEHLPLPLEQLAPAARRAADRTTPEAARMAAAQGLIALPPPQLVPLLYNLAVDPDSEQVRRAAAKSLVELPVALAAGAIKSGVPPVVLDWLGRNRKKDDEIVEAVLLSPQTYDETVKYLAGLVGERQCEIIASNEVRLLRRPEIIEALYMNARARMSTVQRCVELAVRQGIVLEGLPAYREIAAAITGKLIRAADQEGEADEVTLAAEAARAAAENAARDPNDADLVDMNFTDGLATLDRDKEATPEERKTLLEKIAGMTITEKIRFATIGPAEGRGQLVRSSNRLVALAAIKSPAVTDSEAAAYAQSRAVSDDVIRYIARTRELHRSYGVKVSLVNNPKCPLPTSLRLLPHLRQNDLRSLSHNKNIPTAIAEHAKRMLANKQR